MIHFSGIRNKIMHFPFRQTKLPRLGTVLFLIVLLLNGSRLHASTTAPSSGNLMAPATPSSPKDPLIIKPSSPPPLDMENSVSLNFRNVDISVLVRFMSNLMNKNIVMDERVKGKISILSPNRISIDRAFQIFKQSLRMKGFESVTKKGMIFIVPANQAPQDRELFLFTLENTSAKSIAKTINSILSKGFQPPPVGAVSSGGLIGMVQIVPDSPSNSLIISATPHDYHLIKTLLRNLDHPPGEVYVKASLIEISTDKLQNIQVNLLGAVTGANGSGVVGGTNYGMVGGTVNGAVGNSLTGTTGTTTASGAAGAASYLSGLTGLVAGVLTGGTFTYGGVSYPSIGSLLNALQTDTDVRTLSTPEILATDSQKAKITVGEDVPFITGQSQTVGGNVMTMIQRQNVGITLEITPHILAHNRVRLQLKQTISALTNASQLIGTIAVGPTTTKRATTTTLTIASGQTIVIGGLISSVVTKNKSTIPWLGNIPVLGYLFSNTTNEKQRDDLLIFLTPYVIKSNYSYAKIDLGAPSILKRYSRHQHLIETLTPKIKPGNISDDTFLETVNLPGEKGTPE